MDPNQNPNQLPQEPQQPQQPQAPVVPPPIAPAPEQPLIPAVTQPSSPLASVFGKVKPVLKHPVFLVGVLVAIVAAVYLYFFFLPGMFANNFTKATKQPFETYKARIDKTIGSFGRPAFASSETTAANDKKDLEYARKSIEDAQAASKTFDDAAAKLIVLPGTAGTSKAKEAIRQRDAYRDYQKTSGQFLTDYLALIVYFEKLNELQLAQEESGEELTKELESADSPARLAAAFNKMAAEIDKLSGELRKIEAPEYLTEIHNQYLKLVDQTTQLLKAMAGSLDSGDIEALEDDYEEFLKFADEAAKQTAKFIDQLQNHSILREHINRLKGTNVKAV